MGAHEGEYASTWCTTAIEPHDISLGRAERFTSMWLSLDVGCVPHWMEDTEKILLDAPGHQAEGP
jgi:hypothetical protein